MAADSQFALFIERLKTDDALRQKVAEAERAAVYENSPLKDKVEELSEARMTSLKEIAHEAGFDIGTNLRRPGDEVEVAPTEQEVENLCCWSTCCWIETSVWAVAVEGPRG
jgi:hypothetical protein